MAEIATFGQGSTHELQLTLGEPHVVRGLGAHQLSWSIRLQAMWLYDKRDDAHVFAPLLLTGRLWLDDPAHYWLADVQPLSCHVHGYPGQEDILVQLDDDQWVALERRRGERGLSLRFDLQTMLVSTPAPVAVATAQLTTNLGEERWQQLLDQVGSEVGIVLRLRSPLTDLNRNLLPAADKDGPSIGRAVDRVRKARAQLRAHEWASCVATCRHVLEALKGLPGVEPEAALRKIPANQRNQEQRWAFVLHDLYSVASASHHEDDITNAFVWSRAEAEAVLASTASLVTRYQDRT